MRPEDLVEIEALRQLKTRYFHWMDQKRWDEWEGLFTEDALIDTTQEGTPLLHGGRAFREFLEPLLDDVKTVHHGHTSEIEVHGPQRATGVWAMEDLRFWPAEKGGAHLWGTGFYFEEYRRGGDGRWRIQHLKLRRIRTEVNGKQTFPPGEDRGTGR